jgi:hypothetical protein
MARVDEAQSAAVGVPPTEVGGAWFQLQGIEVWGSASAQLVATLVGAELERQRKATYVAIVGAVLALVSVFIGFF